MGHTITFSEFPEGTTNPVYAFADNVVTFIGVIVSDNAQPATPAIAGSPAPSYAGSVFARFQNGVTSASFDGGYFDSLESTEVIFYGIDGSVLYDTFNESLGILHFSFSITGDVAIGSIAEVARGFDQNGFSFDTLNFSLGDSLFTTHSDQVDFNNLTSAQKLDIQEGSQIWLGEGGSDRVVLPSLANYNESVGGGKFLGWTNTSLAIRHRLRSWRRLPGRRHGWHYYIVGGSGSDTVTISGKGSSFYAGRRHRSRDHQGRRLRQGYGYVDGSSTIGSGSTLEITTRTAPSPDQVPIVTSSAGSGGTLIIDGTNFPTNGTISACRSATRSISKTSTSPAAAPSA